MLKSSKLILVALGALSALVVIAAALAFFMLLADARPRAESLASQALGMEVSVVGRVTIGFLPAFRIALADVHVRNGGAEVGSARAVDLGMELLPLLRHEIRIRWIDLKELRVVIERDRHGTLNIDRPPPDTVLGPALAVAQLTASDVTFRYTDQRSEKSFEGTRCNLDARGLKLSSGYRPDLLKRLSFAARLGCMQVRTLGVTSTDVALTMVADNGIVAIDPLTGSLFGGRGAGTIRADFTGEEPAYAVRYHLTQFRIEEFFRLLSPKSLATGPMDFSATLGLRGRTADALLHSAAGTADVQGETLTLEIGDLDEQFARYASSQRFNLVDVAAVFFAGPLGLGITKGYDFARIVQGTAGSTPIRKLISKWRVEHGIAQAQDVAMATRKNRVALQGGLDFGTGQFVDVTVALVDAGGCAQVQQKVRGSFLHPQTEPPSVLQTIAGPTLRLIRQGERILGKKCAVFYAGSIAPPAPLRD